MSRRFVIGGRLIRPGQTRDLRLQVSESYAGEPIALPVRVIRAKKSGPSLLLTAAVHGDEVNGTGIIRDLLFGEPPQLERGALICVPVVNIFGFDRHERYLPDRRDLNRSFPGSDDGSLASRLAHVVIHELVAHADYCLDFHSAAIYRTNFPNVRADLSKPAVKRLAEAFGCELVVNGQGPEGSLRRTACDLGCPTIILEAGEVAKIEPTVLEIGLRGIRNVMIDLGMIKGEHAQPPYQTLVYETTWVRAELGGLLRFHVGPGEIVEGGQPIASNESVFGAARSVLIAPTDGIVLSMTTYPAVLPGEPVCHIAKSRKSIRTIRKAIEASPEDSLARRMRSQLATNLVVHEDQLYLDSMTDAPI